MKVNTITKRPLFMFCVGFFSVFTAFSGVSSFIKLIICPLCFVIGTVFVLKNKCRILSTVLIGAAIASLYSYVSIDRVVLKNESFAGQTFFSQIEIDSVSYSSSYYGYYTGRVIDGVANGTNVSVGISDGSCISGDIIYGEFTFSLPDSSNKDYLLPKGIFICADGESVEYVGRNDSFSIRKVFGEINRKLSKRLDGFSESSLAATVLLGDKSNLPKSVGRDFSRIGISHLIAVSGMHLAVIMAGIEAVFRKYRRTGLVKGVACAAAVVFYMALIGFSPSVTRAGIMYLIKIAAELVSRKNDSLTSLGIAAVSIVAVNPTSIYDVGFILSVSASFACSAYSSFFSRRRKRRTLPCRVLQRCADTFVISFLITAVTLPVSYSTFGSYSLIAPLTNVVFVPMFSILLYMSIAVMFLGGIPFVDGVLSYVLTVLEKIITDFSHLLAKGEHIVVNLRFAFAGVLVWVVFSTVILWFFADKKYRRRTTAALIAVYIVFVLTCTVNVICKSFGSDGVFVTSGKNDGFVLSDGNDFILVDVSDGSNGYAKKLMGIAEELGGTEIEAYVMTHYHRKHISSVSLLVESSIVRQIFVPEIKSETDAAVYENIIKICRDNDVKLDVYCGDTGETLNLGKIGMEFFGYMKLNRSDHPIIRFGFNLGENKYLYGGGSANECGKEFFSNAFESDTVFYGGHPPITKSSEKMPTGGTAVISYYGYLDSAVAGKVIEKLPEDGVYRIKDVNK